MFPRLSSVHCARALLPQGWATNVRIDIDQGHIGNVTAGTEPSPTCLRTDSTVIPGMVNVHSHSFQRAFAGLAERRGSSDDNFWVWREAMYRFAERLDAQAASAIAEQLYTELLLNGYTSIGEFHYLHHSPSGQPYENRAELSMAHLAAARASGLRLAHLPVLYSRGGFDGRPLAGGQKRFENTVDQLLAIRETLLQAADADPTITIGAAIHSRRAASGDQIAQLLAGLAQQTTARHDAPSPIHIHVAEQTNEVEDCLATYGARPVQWLLDNVPVAANWCLIHATHINESEMAAMVDRQVVVGLCPATEANLGDGIFPALEFQRAGGRMSIGSDSHISTSPSEELRLLEYGQRLLHRKRNLLADEHGSVGTTLYQQTATHGAAALGITAGAISPNSAADLVVLRDAHPRLGGRDADAQLDTYVFSGGREMVRDVIVGGRHIVQDGSHANQQTVDERFRIATRPIFEAT